MRRVRSAALAGIVLGALAAVTVVLSWDDPVVTVSGDAPAREFVAAWERSELGTFRVVSTMSRTTTRGGVLEGVPVELIQRPPDRIERGLGNVSGRVGDHRVLCSTDPGGVVKCAEGTELLPSYEDQVAATVQNWDNYFFSGPPPLYTVTTTGDGCFTLTLARTDPLPPYGTSARFCFDERTGARVYAEVNRAEGTTIEEAVEIHTTVTDADLALEGA